MSEIERKGLGSASGEDGQNDLKDILLTKEADVS